MSKIAYRSVKEIRRSFLDFFASKEHDIHASFPLVPINDNSLLLINAGMAPLKNYFTGKETPPAKRMVTCQKCVRTNDIENVGYTARHATFFEMLGNFSFGDYFKKEATAWAWEYVTKVLNLEEELLWVTIYQDDDEAYDLWKNQVGVPEERIVRLGKADNFWEIGNGTGPCGPCSEIYIDRGEKYGCGHEDCKPGCDCDRFLEFWNLVFTQFNQTEDAEYIPLPNPNIDTGMGLERMACIMQGVDSIYDIDTMVKIKDAVCQKAQVHYGENRQKDISIRIIADHVKAVAFLTCDGVLPSNEGRGYILRRLLRRAARHGKLLGIEGPFLQEICHTVFQEYGEAYPDLLEKSSYILKVIGIEEDKFAETIDQGLGILKDMIEKNQQQGETILSGEKTFKLYDTFGFPVDLTKEILAEHDMMVDEEGFKSAMEQQKAMSRKARQSMNVDGWEEDQLSSMLEGVETRFDGYDSIVQSSKIQKLFVNGQEEQKASEGEEVILVLDVTPFYPEGGGQVTDEGLLTTDSGRVSIEKTWKGIRGIVLHKGKVLSGEICVGTQGEAKVEVDLRRSTQRNHTATHLLHQALKMVLGDHVHQAGSSVDPKRLRFDFTHFEGVTEEELKKIEGIVNQAIFENRPVGYAWMSLEEAKAAGATALFDEKYGNEVRVVTVEGFSKELCGGTHTNATGEIGIFKILSEGGVAAGVRRIEAITSNAVYHSVLEREALFKDAAKLLKTKETGMIQKIEQLLEENKGIRRELQQLKQAAAADQLKDRSQEMLEVKGVFLLAQEVGALEEAEMRNLAQSITDKNPKAVVLLASPGEAKVNFVCMAGPEAVTSGAHAGNMIKEVAKIAGGGGGGRPNAAQAGGKNPEKTQEALGAAKSILEGQIR